MQYNKLQTRAPSLKSSKVFRTLRYLHAIDKGPFLIKTTQSPQFCFGIIVTRKIGCAVVRNKAKRRLRHALQESVKTRQSLPTVALALIAKKESLNVSFIDLKSLIEAVLHRLVLKQDEA